MKTDLRFCPKGTLKRAVMNQTWYKNDEGPSRYCRMCRYSLQYRIRGDAMLEMHRARICARVHEKKSSAKKDRLYIFLATYSQQCRPIAKRLEARR